LGPGEGVVHHVAREELQEDDDRHAPEDGEAQPVLGMMADLWIGLVLGQMDGRARDGAGFVLVGHVQAPGKRLDRGRSGEPRPRSAHQSAFKASYWPWSQVAPASLSLCSG